MMTNSVSPIPNPPRASAIRPIGMDELLQNCTGGFVERKLVVADALFIVAHATIARKQLLLWAHVTRLRERDFAGWKEHNRWASRTTPSRSGRKAGGPSRRCTG